MRYTDKKSRHEKHTGRSAGLLLQPPGCLAGGTVMKRASVGSLVCAGLLAVSPGAFAKTTVLSVSLADPTTLTLGNSQRDIAVTSLSFVAGLVPHYTGDAAALDQNGFTFGISALETGTMTYHQACSGRACGTGTTVYGKSWTQGIQDPFTGSYSPIRSTSADLYASGDILDATFNFAIPGGSTASPSPFSFSFQVTDYSLVGAYTLVLTNISTGSVVTPMGDNYSLGAGSYALAFVGGSGASIVTAVQTAAVPEPGNNAMMLAGLGLVGMMARRHKAGQQ